MKINKWPFGWERDYTESQLKALAEKLGLEFITSYGWGYGPALSSGIRTFLYQRFGGEVLSPPPQGTFQKTWIARHFLNCIGVVGRKPL